MDKAVKDKWVKALRSGDYKQGHNGLRSEDDRFCCLGVLCDQWAGTWDLATGGMAGWYQFRLGDIVMFLTIPSDAREELGLTSKDEDALIALNDTECKSFDEIADWIEENL